MAIVPARRGSRSIPGKNHRLIAGKPLVAWVIGAALEAKSISEVVVATDGAEIAGIAEWMGARVFARSAESATDTASTESVLLEVLEGSLEDEFVLLQATSPLTTGADIDRAVKRFHDGGFDSLVSVAPQTRFVWEQGPDGARPVNYDPTRRPRRQDCEPLLIENGALYVSRTRSLLCSGSRLSGRIGFLRMAPETYHELDEPSDWHVVERLLSERKVAERSLAEIALVISDVDGVLTDNGMYWASDGVELKRFSARDGKGFELLHRAGIKTALITSETLDLVASRGAKLGCHHVALGCTNKVAGAEAVRQELDLEWGAIAFIGDDVHDLPLMAKVGASFAPSDAVAKVRHAADHVLKVRGGHGCFREMADLILAAREGTDLAN